MDKQELSKSVMLNIFLVHDYWTLCANINQKLKNNIY
jgi:hypothetical protein